MKREEKLLTAKQVSEMIALSVSAIYAGRAGTDKLKRFNLQPDKCKRAIIRFLHSDVQRWIARQTQTETHAPITNKPLRQRHLRLVK